MYRPIEALASGTLAYATLQVEIMDIIGLLDALPESPDFELRATNR